MNIPPRDYFAGLVLQSLIADHLKTFGQTTITSTTLENIVKRSWEIGNAMEAGRT